MAEEAKPTEDKKKKDKKERGSLMVPIVATLGVINLGGTAFLTHRALQPQPVMGAKVGGAPGVAHAGDPAHPEQAGEHAEGGEAAPAEGMPSRPRAPASGPAVVLDPFIVNLNEEDSSRYLKTTVEVELASEYYADGMGRSKSAVRDEVLRYLSNLTVRDTLGEEQKTKIREAIATRVDKILGRGAVRNLYFTEFVVQ